MIKLFHTYLLCSTLAFEVNSMFLVKKSEAKSPIVIRDEKRDTDISWFY